MDDFKEIIRACPVALGLDGDGIASVVDALVDALVAEGRLDPALRASAVDAVLAREALGPTAISSGVALPHGYIDGVGKLAAAVGVHARGLDCGAPDGAPSRVFVLMLNATRAAPGHIKFLATLNQRLLRPDAYAAILAARSRAEVLAALCPDA